jgi:hypothetical protein
MPPVSEPVASALADVTTGAQKAVNAAYTQGVADGVKNAGTQLATFTAEAEQDDTDTTAAVETAAQTVTGLVPDAATIAAAAQPQGQ